MIVLDGAIMVAVHDPILSPWRHRRHSARVRLHLPADFLTLEGHHKCWIDDLSSSGVRLGIASAPRPDVSGFLRFCGHETFGSVIWTRDGSCGIAFDEPLDHDIVVAMRLHAERLPEIERLEHREAIRRWVDGQTRIIGTA